MKYHIVVWAPGLWWQVLQLWWVEDRCMNNLEVTLSCLTRVCFVVGMESGKLQAEDQPHWPHRIPEHSDRVSWWISVRFWWKGRVIILFSWVDMTGSSLKRWWNFNAICIRVMIKRLFLIALFLEILHTKMFVRFSNWCLLLFLLYRMVRLCCGTWMRASTCTPWMVVMSSMPFASAPTATGCVPPPDPASKSGWAYTR